MYKMIHRWSELTAVREENCGPQRNRPFSASRHANPASSSIGWHHRKSATPFSGWSSCSPLKLIYVWGIPIKTSPKPKFYAEIPWKFCRWKASKKTRSTVEICDTKWYKVVPPKYVCWFRKNPTMDRSTIKHNLFGAEKLRKIGLLGWLVNILSPCKRYAIYKK